MNKYKGLIILLSTIFLIVFFRFEIKIFNMRRYDAIKDSFSIFLIVALFYLIVYLVLKNRNNK